MINQQSIHSETIPLEKPKYTYRLANTVDDLLAAWTFTYGKYLQLGLIKPNSHGLWALAPYISPQSLTVMCFAGAKLVGTCSTVIDGPAGLPLDQQFSREVAAWRAIGQRLNESGLLAIDRHHAPADCVLQLHILSGAFAAQQGYPLFIGGIPPQRKRFYAEKLGFNFIGETEQYKKMQSAPVVLQYMHLDQIEMTAFPHLAKTQMIARSPSFVEQVSHRILLTEEVIADSPLASFRRSIVPKQHKQSA